MSIQSMADVVRYFNLQPGQAVRETVNGYTVEVRMLPDNPAADVASLLKWIQDHRVTPAPGTPDSTEMLREDRQR